MRKKESTEASKGIVKSRRMKRIVKEYAFLFIILSSVLTFSLSYLLYYKPNIEFMGREIKLLEEQTEWERIESELGVLRDAMHRALDLLKGLEAVGIDIAKERDILNQAVDHANKAREYRNAKDFDQALYEIEESRKKFSQLVPIIKDPAFERYPEV